MEENIPVFNNKILGILIAVVVTATVLIPICNAFSDGGDNPSPLASEVWENPGSPMSEIDLSDHSKTYTWDKNDTYSDGTTLFINAGFLGNNGVWVDYSDRDNPFVNADGGHFSKFELKWSDLFQSWVMEVDDDDSLVANIEGNAAYRYDESGSFFGYCGNMYDNIRISESSEHSLTMAFQGYFENILAGSIYQINNGNITVQSYMESTDDEDWVEYEIISTPTLKINDDGSISISGSLVGTYDGDTKSVDGTELPLYYVGGLLPKTVEIGGSDSDSGIASTIIGIIPVFVILAILGSVAYMLIGKNEIQ